MGLDVKYFRCKAPHPKICEIADYKNVVENNIALVRQASEDKSKRHLNWRNYSKCGRISSSYFLLDKILPIGLCVEHAPFVKEIIKFLNEPWNVSNIVSITKEEALKSKSEWVRKILKARLLSLMKEKYNRNINLEQWIELLTEAHNEEIVRGIMRM
jgi:hypothetical protein